MKRLVFIVEGDTEIILVNKLIGPYLIDKVGSFNYGSRTITTNRKQHKKGGVTSFGLFENEIRRTMNEGNVIVTTIIDFFRLPTDFPNYTTEASRLPDIERGIHEALDLDPDFLPNIQLHELEALMFSSIEGFNLIIDDPKQLENVKDIMTKYPNPEDINNKPETAPSKRLEKIFGYDKTADADIIFDMLSMEQLLTACPRFNHWIENLENLIKSRINFT